MNQAIKHTGVRTHSIKAADLAGGRILKLWPLFLGVLISAFAIIYFKDLNRRLFIDYQQLCSVQQSNQVQWGKLLLEQSAWATQARIQNIAQNKLNMMVPTSKDIVMVQREVNPEMAAAIPAAPKNLPKLKQQIVFAES